MPKRNSNPPSALAYDVPELAAAAKVGASTVWAEIASGECESILIGDRRLVTPAQAERWLERKAQRAQRIREERARQVEDDLQAQAAGLPIPRRRGRPRKDEGRTVRHDLHPAHQSESSSSTRRG